MKCPDCKKEVTGSDGAELGLLGWKCATCGHPLHDYVAESASKPQASGEKFTESLTRKSMSVSQANKRIVCNKCACELSEQNKFCAHCGAKAPTLCPACNRAITEQSIFCSFCGATLNDQSRQVKDGAVTSSRAVDISTRSEIKRSNADSTDVLPGLFVGRLPKKPYWYGMLILWLAGMLAYWLASIVYDAYPRTLIAGVSFIVFILVQTFLGVSLFVRRGHDSGKSGWEVLFLIVPLVNLLLLIRFGMRDSEHGSNDYGASPGDINPFLALVGKVDK